MDRRRSNRAFKDAAYAQLARVGKGISSARRLELLDLLAQGPRTVESLAEETAASIANTSQHLQRLRAARLVEAEKKGLYVEYRLADEHVSRFLSVVRDLAQIRLAEVERITRAFLTERGALEHVEGDELLRRVHDGEVTVIDVRPAGEYAAGHIPGALSIPLAELPRRLARLPKSRELAAYCRGPYCVMAVDAVALLRKKGFRAHRLELGVADWHARGWPVERPAPHE